jgi:hypothetical protein
MTKLEAAAKEYGDAMREQIALAEDEAKLREQIEGLQREMKAVDERQAKAWERAGRAWVALHGVAAPEEAALTEEDRKRLRWTGLSR